MTYSRNLPSDMVPTFWRVPGTQQIVVSLFRRWRLNAPDASQVMLEQDVHRTISTPTTAWEGARNDERVMFARASDLLCHPKAIGSENDREENASGFFRFCGVVTMDFDRGFRARENWHVNVLHTGYLSQAMERFLDTMNSKMSRRHASAVHGRQQLILLAARFGADSIDDDDIWKLFSIGPLGCITNMDIGLDLPMENGPETSRTLLPTLEIEGPSILSPEMSARLVVRLIDPATGRPYPSVPRPVEVHLEATAGYLPRRRITAENGEAVFDIHALALQAGDAIKVKAGFWNFTGAAEHIIKVV